MLLVIALLGESASVPAQEGDAAEDVKKLPEPFETVFPPKATPPTGSSKMPGTISDKEFTNSLGMKFVPVPGTEVLFCIHEVRWKDYAVFAKETPDIAGDWKNQTHDGFVINEKAEDHPVVRVNWEEANAFCRWLSKKEGRTYRLPTDAEWSMAVGIGSKEDNGASPGYKIRNIVDEFPWGSEWPPPQGAGNYSDQSRKTKAPNPRENYLESYEDGFPTTASVMSFKPNQFGLYDLGGNVWEWVADKFIPSSTQFVLRGNSWLCNIRDYLWSSNRTSLEPHHRIDSVGFRCVLSGGGLCLTPGGRADPGGA